MSSIRRVVIASVILLTLGASASVTASKKLWKKEWFITVAVPDSSAGNHFGAQTFTIKARKFNVSPSPLPLNKLTATTIDGIESQGVWRQFKKDFSLTFELPCEPDATCGTLILRGKYTSGSEMSGQAIVIWDTRDQDNVAGFETVNGTFEGVQQ